MTPNNIIKFAPTVEIDQQKAPWDRTAHRIYEDLIFKDEFVDRKLKLETGPNWIRIVPALMESNNWMLHIPAIAMKHGRFAHPRTLTKGGASVFDRAYKWFVANSPGKLFNNSNPSGHRLLCDSLCAFWCLLENTAGKVEARLFLGSANGSHGGPPGLGFRIWNQVTEPDDDTDAISDPVHPNRGALVCIEKTQPTGTKIPTYRLRVGRQPAPIQSYLDRMEPAEIDALRPIEKTIRELSEDEQWEHLARMVGTDVAARIRTSHA